MDRHLQVKSRTWRSRPYNHKTLGPCSQRHALCQRSCSATVLPAEPHGDPRLRIEKIYSHLNGHEWLLVHQRKIWAEIEEIVSKVDANRFKTKISKEKGMRGKHLFAPIELNKRFSAEFNGAGWHESRTNYWVTDDYKLIRKTLLLPAVEQKKEIEEAGHRPIFSYNQTDFVKNRVAVEIQLGKY